MAVWWINTSTHTCVHKSQTPNSNKERPIHDFIVFIFKITWNKEIKQTVVYIHTYIHIYWWLLYVYTDDGPRSDRQSVWWTMDGGLWHCTGDREQDHPQEKETQKMQNALRRPYK